MRLILIFLSLAAFASVALAETKEKETKSQSIIIELNSQKQVGQNCQVSFVLKNNLDTPISQFSFELVLFNQKHQVEKLLVLKSGELPVGKTRVKRYDLKSIKCKSISRYLLNDIKKCDATGFSPKLCLQFLILSNKTPSEFGL